MEPVANFAEVTASSARAVASTLEGPSFAAVTLSSWTGCHSGLGIINPSSTKFMLPLVREESAFWNRYDTLGCELRSADSGVCDFRCDYIT